MDFQCSSLQGGIYQSTPIILDLPIGKARLTHWVCYRANVRHYTPHTSGICANEPLDWLEMTMPSIAREDDMASLVSCNFCNTVSQHS